MSLFSFIRKVGKRTTDSVVGVTSGATPVGALDSPNAFRTIAVIGILAIGASGWLLYHAVFSATKLRPLAKTNTNASTPSLSATSIAELKQKDTDGDGLSDYDELYNYHSSPYLWSSAGDGISDGEKVRRGLDPSCPIGKTCQNFHLLTSVVDANGSLTPEFLRRALQSAGVPQATLEQLDDATLLQIYNQIINTTPTNTNSSATNSNGNTNSTASTTNTSVISNSITNVVSNTNASSSAALSQLEGLSPSAIRVLLVQNGVDASSLSTVDDTTLQQIFQQAVQSSQ